MPAMMQQGMVLSELLEGFSDDQAIPAIDISGLTLDSRAVLPGYVFMACRGVHHHGLEYAPQAIEKGAVAIVYEPASEAEFLVAQLKSQGNTILVPVNELTQKLGLIGSRFYGEPSHRMKVVGVTGTDGKTSCSQFIAQALTETGRACGVLGTIGYGLYNKLTEASHTTPDALRLQGLLVKMTDDGAKHVVMEVSSHALEQGRVNGVEFDIAILTNLSRDHLDYHGTLENYASAKEKLFDYDCVKTLVLNLDDEFGCELARKYSGTKRVIGYSMKADAGAEGEFEGIDLVRCTTFEPGLYGLKFGFSSPWGDAEIETSLFGSFNVSNLLATFTSLMSLGIGFHDAVDSLEKLNTVPGRMEMFRAPGHPVVLVDYAHTPKALEHVLTSIREHGHKHIWCVFGCGGDRDQGKREPMGEIAARLADQLIITDDNPRSEDPDEIVDMILSGIQRAGRKLGDVQIEHDRARAIQSAIAQASEEDVVLIAGKGHEDYQLIGSERRQFSDRKFVSTLLSNE